MAGKRADLRVYWSKREKALLYWGSKPTGGMLSMFFEGLKLKDAYGGLIDKSDPELERSLAQELDARGYDLTTLRFSIRKKEQGSND